MSLPEPPINAIDVVFENILDFLLPFFLVAAGGEADVARSAIQVMAEPYDACTVTELDLVGRILGFSVVAMDNLRLSMSQGMSDNKILRYRSNAVALSRAGERCREILEVMQGQRKLAQKAVPIAPPRVPEPRIEPAPPAVVRKVPAGPSGGAMDTASVVGLPMGALPAGGLPADFLSGMPKDIESMKREARILMAAFSKNGAVSGAAMVAVPKNSDPAAMVDAAVRQAFDQAGGRAGSPRR